jgi:hypothetical protein
MIATAESRLDPDPEGVYRPRSHDIVSDDKYQVHELSRRQELAQLLQVEGLTRPSLQSSSVSYQSPREATRT